MSQRSLGFLIILLVVGGLIGSLLGLALGNLWPVVNYTLPVIGFAPITIDLAIANFTLGFTLQLNVASTVGLLLAFFVYFRF
ncbi:MAG TPA: DUF4321 domain-containing protein [Clostridia bacterium]|nr:DUF4321 domain-containing protein [Clostridia bacterium]